MLTNTETSYSGTPILETMKEAKYYNRFLFKLIEKHGQQAQKWLDFGAGMGTFAISLAKSGQTVLCIEPDLSLKKALEQSGLKTYRQLEELENNSIDYIYSLNVLEHILDDKSILSTMFQKLTPGGKLMIYVPAFELLFSSVDKKAGHFRRYLKSPLKQLLSTIGYQVHCTYYVDCLGFFATLLFKLFDSGKGNINKTGLILFDRLCFPISQCLDLIFRYFFGKNVYIVASRPNSRSFQSC